MVIGAIALMVLTGDREPHRDLVAEASFVDRNENGRVSVLAFHGHAPAPEKLASVDTLTRLTVSESPVSSELATAIGNIPSLRSVSLAGCRISVQNLGALERLPELRELNLNQTDIDASVLFSLKLPALTDLYLNNCDWVTDDVVSELSAFPELQSLDLGGTRISAKGVSALSGLRDIRGLELKGCPHLGDEVFAALQQVKSLRSVQLSGDHLTLAAIRSFQKRSPDVQLMVPLNEIAEFKPIFDRDRYLSSYGPTSRHEVRSVSVFDKDGIDYSPLRHFPELTSLRLSGPGVTDKSLSVLPDLPALSGLRLSQSAVTDEGMKSVSQLANLTSLDISQTIVSDAGMANLTGLKNLRSLDISESLVTEDGLEHVASMESLEYLSIEGIELSDRSAKLFQSLSNLSGHLDLPHTVTSNVELRTFEGKAFTSVSLAGQSLHPADYDVIASWKHLQVLDLSDSGVTGETLDLRHNNQLVSLDLSGTRLTDAAVGNLQLPNSLRHLSLAKTSINGETLGTLAGLELSSLDLSSTPLTQQGILNAFALRTSQLNLRAVTTDVEIPALGRPDGSNRTITIDADGPLLRQIAQAQDTDVVGTFHLHAARDAHLALMPSFAHLHSLTLTDSTISSSGFQNLSDADYMYDLRLDRCSLTPEAVNDIAELEFLDVVEVVCAREDFEKFAVLQKLNPALEVRLMDSEQQR